MKINLKSYWPQGTVYGALLNFKKEWNLRAPQMPEAPYKGAPKAPVLFIKTANTFTASGDNIAIPSNVLEVKCVDGFLGVGAQAKSVAEVQTDAVVLTVKVNGQTVQSVNYADTVRASQKLLADISEFMTFQEGDVLLLGSDCLPDGKRPRAKVGDLVEISAPGFESLVNQFVGAAA
jgi:5-oxopent-3-ene-1,2,5-tricarboxylate decarboxylase/2-hydroxyhepta-2,4-diene-1,7-dioate isomerase